MSKKNFVNGYVLFECNEGTFMVDTGSPNSFSETGSITVCGTRYLVPTRLQGIDKSYVSNKVGVPVEGLLGMDILGQYPIVFDYAHDRFAVGERLVDGTPIESFDCMGLVGIVARVNGHKVNLLLDSGAVTNYIARELSEGRPVVGEVEDFSPLLDYDTFSTRLYEVPVEVTGRQLAIQFGNLPEELEYAVRQTGAQGAIGKDLLEQCAVGIEKGAISVAFPN